MCVGLKSNSTVLILCVYLTCLLTPTHCLPTVVITCTTGVGVAVALSDYFNEKYSTEAGIRNVGIVLCGGNVDVLKIAARMQDMGL
jgi:transcriptional regulatory protein LevR